MKNSPQKFEDLLCSFALLLYDHQMAPDLHQTTEQKTKQ